LALGEIVNFDSHIKKYRQWLRGRLWRIENSEKVRDKKKADYVRNREQVKLAHKAYYEKNKKAILAKQKKFYAENREAVREKQKPYYEKNKAHLLSKQKAYNENNKEKNSARTKRWVSENAGRRRAVRALWKSRNLVRLKAKRLEYERNRRRNDPVFRLLTNLRSRVHDFLKKGQRSAASQALMGTTPEGLKSHLEAQFKPGMSWTNYGRGGWEVDHKRPCVSFNLVDPEQQRRCFHYSNLQPLWKSENLAKGDKIISETREGAPDALRIDSANVVGSIPTPATINKVNTEDK
jgi:Prasinovirus endonuclease VII